MTIATMFHSERLDAASAAQMVNAFSQVVKSIPLLGGRNNEAEYKKALELIEYLVDRDDLENPLFEPLAAKIAEYENTAPKFEEFNRLLENVLQGGIAVLRTIMDQYGLKAADLESELGSKSNVSNILNGRRALTVHHIKALSERFHIPAEMFID
ncbi:helix-turn-helix domain-containing protein (plasmid) [Candidatus Fukatsuia symbiotica]|uniref:Transcriptional regulator n=1 Tax=Candidatus Fukatsuia symbiotica TaxID=1878942 RepID=A0A2U8I8R4_9GAMM|nr:helix-turn-helix domain-containing protein [Candidatus Fukatsuia symbiotica]AWK15572.1 transcriptional regulator [Candidatus Fukatsuia symbiotica]MEA9445836.1 helix-turn-helix domain-containing protein [Candidatus Fukatsuia symbiotica]